MNIKTRKKLSDALAEFGVWGGCFIIPAIVGFTTNNKYCAVIAIAVVALPALWASKKIKKSE